MDLQQVNVDIQSSYSSNDNLVLQVVHTSEENAGKVPRYEVSQSYDVMMGPLHCSTATPGHLLHIVTQYNTIQHTGKVEVINVWSKQFMWILHNLRCTED